jgi:hypothetical protein
MAAAHLFAAVLSHVDAAHNERKFSLSLYSKLLVVRSLLQQAILPAILVSRAI